MPFPVITLANVATCAHQGKATPPAVGKVLINGVAAVTSAQTYLIAGCTYPTMTSGAQACVSAKIVTLSAQVRSMGVPLAMLVSPPTSGTCQPTALPLIVNPLQTQVFVT